MPHVVPFINFNEDEERAFSGIPDTAALVLARTWGIYPDNVPETLRERARRANVTREESQSNNSADALARELERIQPNHPLAVEWRERQAQNAVPPGQAAINLVRELLGEQVPSPQAPTPRQLIEHTAIVDTLRVATLAEAATDLASVGDASGGQELRLAGEFARQHLGIHSLKIVSDFPIGLCAVGYTRITRDPARSMLTPFESTNDDGRIPLYVITSETEGIYFQLDAVRVVEWLVANRWVAVDVPRSPEQAWAWLYSRLPGLYEHRWQPNFNEPLTTAVRTLLHTISHVLLRHVEWSGFSQNSIGEYLIPGALSGILYANRYAETKIGGLTTLFEHRLGIWLDDSAQSGRECVYDPFCTDEGGTCVGCLHREHNCPQFNRELSRAVLYGGPAPPPELGGQPGIQRVERGFWQNVPPASAIGS
jgi:hypothetical protein